MVAVSGCALPVIATREGSKREPRIVAGAAPVTAPDQRAERRYQVAVRRDLTRNFTAHLFHGMLGQTGFRLLNAPTFLPAFILMISGGSDAAVGIAMALQSFGMMATPLIGAAMIEHRARVLPTGFVTGAAMRLCVLAIALAGLLLPPHGAPNRPVSVPSEGYGVPLATPLEAVFTRRVSPSCDNSCLQ
jgi:hypothetical protein